MKIQLITVGTRMPSWVNEGVQTYQQRLPKNFALDIIEIPLGKRAKTIDLQRSIQQESEAMLRAIAPQHSVIALDERGQSWSTTQLAQQLETISHHSAGISLLVGGPDGLSSACKQRAEKTWSLSALTLPHPLVRIMVAEAIYRAWTVLQNHPYHRA